MRLPATLLSALLLAGCGFHPRAELVLPDSLGPITVQTADPYSPLGLELAASLERAGAAQGAEGAPAAALKITAENWNTAPLSVDELARVREYTYDITASAGSPAEQELIQRELRSDMRRVILRRIDVVLRPRS
jgi:LPS-assembly lipoprotein